MDYMARQRHLLLDMHIPGWHEIPFQVEPNGNLNAEIADLKLFVMLSAEYSR